MTGVVCCGGKSMTVTGEITSVAVDAAQLALGEGSKEAASNAFGMIEKNASTVKKDANPWSNVGDCCSAIRIQYHQVRMSH
jgi:hypothetical protein